MVELKAAYSSASSDPKDFIFSLPTVDPAPSTDDRTAYLSALRSSLTQLQDQVNVFFTKKMEEDKAVDDAAEEENYGEEVVEDD